MILAFVSRVRRSVWTRAVVITATFACAFIAAVLPLMQDLREVLPWIPQRLELYCDKHKGWTALFVLAAGGLQWTRTHVLRASWVHGAVNVILDLYLQQAVTMTPGQSFIENRVTLFKYCRFWPVVRGGLCPVKACLRIVERSSHVGQRSKTVFLAENSCMEGVAGLAWKNREGRYQVGDLPDINGTSSREEIEEYAEQVGLTRTDVEKRIADGKMNARAFLAFVIPSPQGPNWGVLVVDTAQPDAIKARSKPGEALVSSSLSHLVVKL